MDVVPCGGDHLRFCGPGLARHRLMLQDNGYWASIRGVPVFAPAFASTKLYCFVTETHGCEQLAHGCYSTARLGLELATTD